MLLQPTGYDFYEIRNCYRPPFMQNSSVLWCEKTKKTAIVDPGGDLHKLKACLDKHGLTLEKILLTHAHIDHAGGTADLADKLLRADCRAE